MTTSYEHYGLVKAENSLIRDASISIVGEAADWGS